MAESIDEAINDNKYDDTKIKEEQEKQNKSIEKNAENIEKNATDIQTLQEENANLKAQIPTGEASGEEISLQDSAEMELIDFGLEGNSKQETRSGKNEIFVSDGNIQDSGINIIKKDGIITVSGTATKSIQNCYVSVKRTFTENYILSSNVSGTTNGLHIKVAYKKGEENLQYPDIDTSLKLNANDYLDQVYLIVDAGATINATIKLQLEKGEIATTFEEYGAMPSLNYLSEVQAVGDNINLYPYENVEFKSDATQEQWCYLDGQLGAYGNTVTDKTDYKITLEKGKYYFKLETADSNITTGGLVANGESSEKQLTLFDNAFEITETTVCTLRLKVANPSLGINIKSIKLEKGTAATAYSPYGQGSVEIVKSNKNLINNLPSTTTINGITFTNNGDGTITINGTATSVAYIVLKTLTLEDIDYSISGCPQGGSNETYSQYIFIPSTGGGLANDFGKGATFRNSNKPTVEVRLRIASGYKANNLIFRPQLEKGAATNFVENESKTYIIPVQKPFYKLGDYADRFIKQDEKWYEQHNIREYQITGNENWKLSKSNDEFYKYEWANGIADKLNVINTILMCSHFSQITVSQSDSLNVEGIANGSYPNYSLMIVSKQLKTLENFKSKLQELYNAGTPVKVYYVLATPELIECTEEQTQVLEQIVKDGTYKEITHFYTTDDLKPTIEVKYYKDLETLFNKQVELENTLNNVQAQILELGGN